METQKVKFSLIVFDACRKNPIKGSNKGKLKGLASIDAPAGSLVMYTTKARDVAYRNSPFTVAILKHITTPGLDVNLLPSRVTKTVSELTNGKQTPGSYMQITQSFTFVPELTTAELEQIRKQQQGKLTELQKREAEMKEFFFNETITKYNKIASSEDRQDLKPEAWNTVLKNLGIAKGSIKIGDVTALKMKFYDIPPQIIDHRDGKTYKTVRIGNQVWMTENLAYYAGSGCWAYSSDTSNVTKYGYLYNWQTAKNVCPNGWHLPTKAEFETLLNNYGGGSDSEANYTALIPIGNSGFSASFGGWRFGGGGYRFIGRDGYFWSSSTEYGYGAWQLYVSSKARRAGMDSDSKSGCFSVRCLQDN